MKIVDTIHQLAEYAEQDIPLLADMDECLVGVVCRKYKYYAVYSKSQIIKKLMRDNDWSYLVATEWFDYNIEDVYAGPQSPLYLIDEFPDGVHAI
jgi:hypothetical protein